MNNLNAEDIEFAGPHPDAVVQLAKRFRSKTDLFTYMRDIVVINHIGLTSTSLLYSIGRVLA